MLILLHTGANEQFVLLLFVFDICFVIYVNCSINGNKYLSCKKNPFDLKTLYPELNYLSSDTTGYFKVHIFGEFVRDLVLQTDDALKSQHSNLSPVLRPEVWIV